MQTNFNKIEDGTCQGLVSAHLATCDLFISVNGIYIYSITAFDIGACGDRNRTKNTFETYSAGFGKQQLQPYYNYCHRSRRLD